MSKLEVEIGSDMNNSQVYSDITHSQILDTYEKLNHPACLPLAYLKGMACEDHNVEHGILTRCIYLLFLLTLFQYSIK